MKDYKLMTVGQIVAARFDHAKVFNKYVIDFCCSPYYYQLCCASSKHRETAKFIESCVSKPAATHV